jgi:biopolymer transport protein ExbD
MNTRIMTAFLAVTLPLIVISTAWGTIDTMQLLQGMLSVKQLVLAENLEAQDNRVVILSINANGQPGIENKAVPIAYLQGVLKTLQERDSDIEIQLQVDRTAEVASVAEVMASAQRAGLSKLSLVPFNG